MSSSLVSYIAITNIRKDKRYFKSSRKKISTIDQKMKIKLFSNNRTIQPYLVLKKKNTNPINPPKKVQRKEITISQNRTWIVVKFSKVIID